MAHLPRLSPLMRDLAAIDSLSLAANRQVGPPPVPVVTRVDTPASGADIVIESDPTEADASDHYRISSPNRLRGRDDTRMRHRRIRR